VSALHYRPELFKDLIGQKPNQRLRISRQYAPDCVNPDGHCPVFGIATGASRRIGAQ
jgi:hypothetical protein